jgi:tetratricopeptide (TPR) repeat protein
VKTRLLDVALIVAVGGLVYSNTLHAPFTFDDVGQIATSWYVRDLASAAFSGPRGVGRFTFALDYAVHGFDVVGFHVVNLVIHLLAALTVYALVGVALRAAGAGDERRRLASLSTALLFVAHPLQTQAVTYVVQRYTSLAALFYLAALLLYALSRSEARRDRRVLLYGGSMLAALLAMGTKEIAVTLPFAMALYELLFVRAPVRERVRHLVLPALLLAVVPLAVLHSAPPPPGGAAAAPAGAGTPALGAVLDTAARAGSTVARDDYLLTQARVVVTYLRLLAFPVGQNVDWDYSVSRSLDLAVVASALALAALLGAGVWLVTVSRRRSSPEALLAGFGIVFFFLAISVESSVIPIRDVIAEHRLYLPSFGLFAAAGAGIAAAHERLRLRSPGLAGTLLAAAGALVLVLGAATWARNQLWADPVELWRDAAAKSPNKARPILNWAGALRERGDRQAALQLAVRALPLEPSDHEEMVAFGYVYRELGDLQGARRCWEASLKLRPLFGPTLVALGNLAWDEGDRGEARRYLELAVQAEPQLATAHLKLAAVLGAMGEEARSYEELELFLRYALPSQAREAALAEQMLRERRTGRQ